MRGQGLFLSPGLCLTLTSVPNRYIFPQLDGQMKRATPARLKIVDVLSRGFDGGREELAGVFHRQFNIPKSASGKFLEALESAGYLSDVVVRPRDEREPARESGNVPEDEVTIATPVSFVVQSGYYCLYSHEGKLSLRLTLSELLVVAMFVQPRTVADVRSRYSELDLPEKIDPDQFDDLIARVAGARLFWEPLVAEVAESETELFATVDRNALQSLVDARIAAHDERVAREGRGLVQVTPVNTVPGTTPASLGVIMAYAMEYDGGRLRDKYDFVPMFLTDEARIAERARTPGIFLFSNYLWNIERNLELSALIKQIDSRNITIHGGPSTPSYEKDCEVFFAEHPHIDIAVRGEGELTFSDVLDKLNSQDDSLEVLQDVPGVSYRTETGVHRTGNRDRIPELDTIPSPYLTGLFEEFGAVRASSIIETNRGCPYGCTFCDWGSATLSKVRKFSLDRVFAELEWCARHRVEDASIADANFGMLERDVEVTQKIADLKKAYGYPNTVGINYAKNQVRYLRDIIRILAEAGILAEGKLSFQSTDEATLKAIDRSNIKLSKYNELASEFRRAQLPLGVELMMGLPGSSIHSFRNDLQDCTNRDVRVQVCPTLILPNSPMNDPSYREEHGIIAKAGEYVKETATYSREDWEAMMQLRGAYALLDTYGIARYLARYVRGETGMHEINFYDGLQTDAANEPSKWPVIAAALRTLADYMAPPGSWSFFIEELKRYAVERLGLPDDSGLRTTLAVQLAHLPAVNRQFPAMLELEHDFAAWWRTILEAREEGHHEDWEKHVPRLAEYGPSSLTITDPNKICILEVGKSLTALGYNLRTWELDSPVARARTHMAARQW